MKCDELKRKYSDITGPYYGYNEVNEAIAELKARIQLDEDEMVGFLQLEEECGGGDLRNYIEELKAKLESVQASAYAESVDAGMRERRLQRALYKACANWMINRQVAMACYHLEARAKKFEKAIEKCLKKAEE